MGKVPPSPGSLSSIVCAQPVCATGRPAVTQVTSAGLWLAGINGNSVLTRELEE
ncbi:hypothetical protein PENSUB_4687 [Penicillium subrubescens]|uniref:Uncharacterized protein n=1 Tax=Penicillium subrubescens TaxID=1316194 RepID=A0A1Q5UR31_9EURO|nr:hypothetical protein PENSUB_4687 [Penicillium subrubescens]